MSYLLDESELERIYLLFKKNGLSLLRISDAIGYNFKHVYYGKCRMSEEMKNQIESYLGIKIDFLDRRDAGSPPLNVKKGGKLAEMFGIILGDGNIINTRFNNKLHYTLTISLNFVDWKDYVVYVKEMLIDIFGKCYERPKAGKGGDLIINSKNVVEFLIENGLKSGNKIKNQVGVPSWIKENGDYEISCLKGLIDTDGCIFIRKKNERRRSTIGVNFSNRSDVLIDDFIEMCFDLGINAHRSGHNVNILSVKDVRKVIDTIQPFKWRHFEDKIAQDADLARKFVDRVDDFHLDGPTIERMIWEMPVHNIAEKLGIDINTVYRACHKFKISVPERGYWEGKLEIGNPTVRRQFEVSRSDLERIIWEKPIRDVAKDFGVSDSAIIKRCKRFDIERPGRGYWVKIYSEREG